MSKPIVLDQGKLRQIKDTETIIGHLKTPTEDIDNLSFRSKDEWVGTILTCLPRKTLDEVGSVKRINVPEEQASNTVEMIFVDGKLLESDEYTKDSNGYKLGQVIGQGSRTTLVELFIGDVDCVVPEFIK